MFRGSQGGTTGACTAASETMGPSHDGNLVSLDQQSARVAMVRPDLAAGITETTEAREWKVYSWIIVELGSLGRSQA